MNERPLPYKKHRKARGEWVYHKNKNKTNEKSGLARVTNTAPADTTLLKCMYREEYLKPDARIDGDENTTKQRTCITCCSRQRDRAVRIYIRGFVGMPDQVGAQRTHRHASDTSTTVTATVGSLHTHHLLTSALRESVHHFQRVKKRKKRNRKKRRKKKNKGQDKHKTQQSVSLIG
ncbi:unnamed protein product [Ectocarpus fasciculatus]